MSGAGFAKYANDLVRASTGIDKLAERVAERIGLGTLKTAQSLVPVDSGDLERSLTFRRKGSVATVTSSLYYSAFQEFGTSQMAPNPFIGPAAVTWGERLVAEVEGIRDKVIRDLG